MGHLLAFTENDERYKDVVNMEVIKFIDSITDFPDRNGKVSENIDHLFCAGYCYYFANMLQLAFGGTVCWVQDRGHVVWLDGNDVDKDVAYDVTGVYTDYEKLWPIEYLGDTVVNFLHNGEEFHLNDEFKEWCDSCGISETSAIETIWGCIPMDEIEECYKKGLNLVDTAYQFWSEYKVAFRNIFICLSYHPIDLLPSEHKGVRHLKAMVE